MSLNILLTNFTLTTYTGTEIYVRDVALELARQGHTPAVYSPWLGKPADDLRALGIEVTDSLRKLNMRPDVIHGHHRYETLSAIKRFPGTPAIYICHDHTHWADTPPRHSHIQNYFGVSELCVERIRRTGIDDEKIGQVYNFVDLARFTPRRELPQKPQRALVFSNYATDNGFLPAVTEACDRMGVELSVVGKGVGRQIENPEQILGEYDIVFAKAKAAMEAMAVGCAVVLCDYGGVGPVVTRDNFVQLKPLNFGYAALTAPHSADILIERISQYNPEDARAVCELIRSTAGLEHAVSHLVGVYQGVLEETIPHSFSISDAANLVVSARFAATYKTMALWRSLPKGVRRLGGLESVKRSISRLICGRMN